MKERVHRNKINSVFQTTGHKVVTNEKKESTVSG